MRSKAQAGDCGSYGVSAIFQQQKGEEKTKAIRTNTEDGRSVDER